MGKRIRTGQLLPGKHSTLCSLPYFKRSGCITDSTLRVCLRPLFGSLARQVPDTWQTRHVFDRLLQSPANKEWNFVIYLPQLSMSVYYAMSVYLNVNKLTESKLLRTFAGHTVRQLSVKVWVTEKLTAVVLPVTKCPEEI